MMTGKVDWRGQVNREVHWRWPERDTKMLRQALSGSRLGRVYKWFC